jgi:hypothetical protein
MRHTETAPTAAFGRRRHAAGLLPRGAALFAALVVLAGCSEPFIVFSGKALSGEPTEPPADWAAIDAVDTLQLETRPTDPYSVNLWAVGIGADVYVGTDADGTRWSGHVRQDPRVRLRVGEALYDLVAQPVLDPAERRRVADAYVAKYELDSDGDWINDALVFRLDRP